AEVEALFTALAGALGAVQAGLYHPLHRQAVMLPAANRLAASQGIVPPPDASLPGPTPGLPPEADALAMPVSPFALDLARLPEAVWWLNLWTAPLLAALPAGAVAAAPWHRQAPLAAGVLLVAAAAPPGPRYPEGFAALRAVTDALGLHALHRAAAGDPAS
ncbi:hypothetical protein, partial [Falsiroseomonas sp.]|uniref:hypothetical protein n=1 Tax=Falsiroseomonas sp. TaxID=2870721 RepID=UPI0027351CBB